MPFAPSLISSHLPTAPFCLIMVLSLGWNLLVKRFPALSLNSRELTIIMAFMLVACFPPNAGLFRHFQRQLTLPWYYLAAGGQSEWEKFHILEYIPSFLFPTPAPYVATNGIVHLDDTVYRGIFQGLARGAGGISVSAVPWSAWVGPMLYWGPVIVLMSIAVIALSFLVHRQWAVHEQISYPLAQVLSTLVARKEGTGMPDLFRNRLFWWGFLPVFCLYMLDYLNQWFPMSVPGLKTLLPNLRSWNVPLQQYFPLLTKSDGFWYLCSQTLMFSVVGAAYFVASEIGLTMGLSQLLVVLFAAWFYTVTGSQLSSRNDIGLMRGGAYLAYALMLIYTGRTYYFSVFRNLFRRRPDPESHLPVLAARTLLLATLGFIGMMALMGLDWFIAVLFALLLLLLFLVFTRIICETGVPFMQAHWWPAPLLTSILGPGALGPGPLVLIGFFGTILAQDPRECLMPYVATGVKMADDAKIKLTKLFGVLTAAVVLALALGFVSVTWTQYSYGGLNDQAYAAKMVPTDTFNKAAKLISEMSDTGILEQSQALHGLGKLKMAGPDPGELGLLAAGAVGVVVFFMLRFRFSRFPLHPVLFLVWGVYAASKIWFSFLVGWAAKSLVVRFGGGRVYHQLRPFFIGLIAGELAIVGVAIIVDAIYYWITGKPPGIQFNVLTG